MKEPLNQFLSELTRAIEEGINTKERDIVAPIEIELSVSKENKKGVGAKLYVITGEVSASDQNNVRVKVRYNPKESERQKREFEENINQLGSRQKDWQLR